MPEIRASIAKKWHLKLKDKPLEGVGSWVVGSELQGQIFTMVRRKTWDVCVDGDYLLDNSLVAIIWDLGFRVWRLGSIGNMKTLRGCPTMNAFMKNSKGMHYYECLLPLTEGDDARGPRVEGIHKCLPLHNKRRVENYGVKIKSMALQFMISHSKLEREITMCKVVLICTRQIPLSLLATRQWYCVEKHCRV